MTLLLSSLLISTKVAGAEPDIERARRLFDEASSLREAGQFGDALARLKLAIAIKDTPGLEYHAGFCEAKLGHYVKAIERYEKAASLIRAGATAPDVVALLNQAHKSALQSVGHVHLQFAGPVAGALLRVDDEPEQPLRNSEVLLDPGKHRLLLRAPGFNSEERHLTVNAAEDLQVAYSLSPIDRAPRATAVPRDTSVWRSASIGTALGVTALGLTTGIVAAVGHSNASSSEQAARAGGPTQSARLAAAQRDKQTYATLETVGFVAAGVGAVATIALWTLWPPARAVSVTAWRDVEHGSSAEFRVTSTF